MRTAFVDRLCALARDDERVWLLTGDLGFSVLERFAALFPARFVNAGVAEQNMIGVAAGLALSGKVAFVYSIANFPVMRCLEQIRNDVCFHELDVKIVSVGGGLAYGSQGYTHHGVEDIAVMRAMPGMTVLSPADCHEARWAADAALSRPGPAYVRLGKAAGAGHSSEPMIELGRAVVVAEGEDVALVSTGAALSVALAVARQLAVSSVRARVLSLPTLKPIDEPQLAQSLGSTRLIATIEEHGPIGGLYSCVLESLVDRCSVHCLHFALPEKPSHVAGSSAYLGARGGLDPHSICASILAALGTRRA